MIDTSEKFSWLVRLGYAARGIIYAMLGYLALTTAGQAQGGSTAVLAQLSRVGLGTPILWLMAVGLLAYALFKAASAIGDVEGRGSDAKGIAKRIGDAASAVAHLVLAYAAFQYASGLAAGGGADSDGSQAATRSLLELPMGSLLIGLIGVGFVVGAVMQAKSAATAGFMRHVSGRAPAAVRPIGRLGHGARAMVFAIIGWSLVRAGWVESEAQAKGLGAAILSLRDNDTLYSIVAAGLLLFGVFSLIVARYRIIPRVHAADLKPGLD